MSSATDLRQALAAIDRRLCTVTAACEGTCEASQLVRLRELRVELLRHSVSVTRSLLDHYDIHGDSLRMGYLSEQLGHRRHQLTKAIKQLRQAKRDARRNRREVTVPRAATEPLPPL
jgi:hypothetical protein